MKELSFYEQAGIVLPGAIALFGLLLLFPDLRSLFATDGISVGGLGLFLIVAYALGHSIAALGNLIEKPIWKILGGMPSDWVTGSEDAVISPAQIINVQNKLQARLGVDVSIAGISRKEWKSIFAQIYADVLASGRTDRVTTFNGNYGLNRGIATAAFALTILSLICRPEHWAVFGCAFVLFAVLHGHRTIRFGVYFAREVYLAFLLLPDARQ